MTTTALAPACGGQLQITRLMTTSELSEASEPVQQEQPAPFLKAKLSVCDERSNNQGYRTARLDGSCAPHASRSFGARYQPESSCLLVHQNPSGSTDSTKAACECQGGAGVGTNGQDLWKTVNGDRLSPLQNRPNAVVAAQWRRDVTSGHAQTSRPTGMKLIWPE